MLAAAVLLPASLAAQARPERVQGRETEPNGVVDDGKEQRRRSG